MQVDEPEIVGYFFLTQANGAASAVIGALDDELVESMRVTLSQILYDHAVETDTTYDVDIVVEVQEINVEGPRDLKSILYKSENVFGARRIIAFNLRDGFVESGLPLLGLCVLLFSGAWGAAAIPGIAAICKALWGRLIVLRRPGDAEAIDTLETLLTLKAERVSRGDRAMPTTAEIAERYKVGVEALQKPIRRLTTLKVIDCCEWGGQYGDLDHSANRWRVPI